MKKIIQYLKSPKSDIFLFAIVLILLNLVCSKAFFRIDITGEKAYSLSPSSKQIVKTLEQPLSVKVFFTKNLPAPYNTVEQYVKDLLVEYKGNANSNFSWKSFDMSKKENEQLARGYGLSQVQIQELKNNEVGFKQAWMGIAVSYGDSTEVIDSLSSVDGLEYAITTTMSRLISTQSALSGLEDNVKLTLYTSEKLNDFNIQGFKNIESSVEKAFENVNKKNMNRIVFQTVHPTSDQIPELAQKYGVQVLTWNENGENVNGTVALVLEYKDSFKLLPLKMASSFFGNVITGLDTVEDDLQESLKSLLSKTDVIGYITGHNELSLSDSKEQAGLLNNLVSDRYEFKEINLETDDIGIGIKSIFINGPTQKFSDEELYKIDQFLMKGGNIIFFTDMFEEIRPQGQAAYYTMPTYEKIDSGLEKLLSKYGVTLGNDYVMDENCYVNQDQYYGSTPLYFAPLLQKNNFAKNHPITNNLGYVIMLQNSSIDASSAQNNPLLDVTVLAKSSKNSWLMKDEVSAIPQMIRKPSDKSTMKEENLAVLVEGKFESAFESSPVKANENSVKFNDHYSKSVQKGKIMVVGTSKITTPQVIDPQGKQPVAIFVRNALDYMNGEIDSCRMRTKGLSLNTLSKKSGNAVNFAKYFNEFGLLIFVAVAGIIAFVKISAKKRRIHDKYNFDDKREIKK